MTRRLILACLLTVASAAPAFGQTHLTLIEGGGGDRGAFGGTGTFDLRAAGIDWHLARHWWVGVEGGVIGGTGHGFASSDRLLVIPVNLYAYRSPGSVFDPFVTLGYTSVMIVGVGFDAGIGLDIEFAKRIALRVEVRGLTIHDKSGFDGFAMWRLGGVIGLGR